MSLLAKLGYYAKHRIVHPLTLRVILCCSHQARLQQIYGLIDRNQLSAAKGKLNKMAASHETDGDIEDRSGSKSMRRRASGYFEAKGDLALVEGNGSEAQSAYARAYGHSGEPALLMKAAVAMMPCYHAPQEARLQTARALTALGGIDKDHLALHARELRRVLIAQLSPTAERIGLLHQLATRSLRSTNYDHIQAAWEILNDIKGLPCDALWPKLMAGLYGNPQSDCPHPSEIRWGADQQEPHKLFNCAGVALERAIVLNEDLTAEQRRTALSTIWQRTPYTSELNQWAGRTLRKHYPQKLEKMSLEVTGEPSVVL